MYYVDDELIRRVRQMPDYKYIPKGYWIIGIRNPEDNPDRFDDLFYLMHGGDLIMSTTGTTWRENFWILWNKLSSRPERY